jgi:peptide/nickel transport system permease protein
MPWLNLSLLLLIVATALSILFSSWPHAWRWVRLVAVLGFQLSGVLFVTWLLIAVAQPRTSTLQVSGQPNPDQIVAMAALAAEHSIALMAVAITFGTSAGLGLAFLVTVTRDRRLMFLAPLTTLLWIIPTFLMAALVQELQFVLHNVTGLRVSGAYGLVTPLQIFWAAAVLGVRPAAYIFRQTRVTLDIEAGKDHVRAARARGLPPGRIALRYVIRPTASNLASVWMTSFRLMIGSLPLVEFFFAYPGLGQALLLSLGVGYGDQLGQFQPDLAIALVVAMATILITLESVTGLIQSLLDPRVRALRLGEV